MTTRRPALTLAALMALAVTAVGCTGDASNPEPTGAPTASAEPEQLTLGVQGTEAEMEAWSEVVADFNDGNVDSQASLVKWAPQKSAQEVLDGGKAQDVPDVFLTSRGDLDAVLESKLSRPVSELLDERGVDFGDRFARAAVQSFGVDGELQCMAYSISPMVLFVNEKLVDFEKMKARGLNTTHRDDRWNMVDFEEAARFGTRPARKIAGLHIESTVRGLAPFILSAGGSLFDDPETPTTLNFSSDETRDALQSALPVLRDASLTLTEEQLSRRTPMEWFKRGKLGMIAGERSLVPELRQEEKLKFNVMPMPYLGAAATIGDSTGLCISANTKNAPEAADLITHLVSDEATAALAESGSMVPTNLAAAASDSFLQPDQMPERSSVFNSSVRGTFFPPLGVSWAALEEAVAPQVSRLLLEPGEIDLEEITTQIDEASRTVLDPETVEEESGDPSSGAPDGAADE
ncbi:extracellular solute-binding protein [Nocardioides gilvus]|uniref:extracellular solute-binding protein n=1 Tax=Nocardioides gilvus TaxID=1735589 RepID=UPI000D750C9C|nr:extracellular solute-binding protein [Nocardioides gilvus]